MSQRRRTVSLLASFWTLVLGLGSGRTRTLAGRRRADERATRTTPGRRGTRRAPHEEAGGGMKPADLNLETIRTVADRLGPLRERVVLVGGATTGRLMLEAAAPTPRRTKAVDVVVEIASLVRYGKVLGDQLFDLGFSDYLLDDGVHTTSPLYSTTARHWDELANKLEGMRARFRVERRALQYQHRHR